MSTSLPRSPRIPPHLEEKDGSSFIDDLAESFLSGDFSQQPREDTVVERSHISQAQFTGATLSRLCLTDVVVEHSDFSGAELDESVMTRVAFHECRMSGALLTRCTLRDVSFTGCRLDQANFRMSGAKAVLFEETDLKGSDFYAATLESTRFFDCDLTNAEFTKTSTPGVRFHGSTLLDLKGAEHLVGAIIESRQVLPVALAVLAALRIGIEDEREPPDPVNRKGG